MKKIFIFTIVLIFIACNKVYAYKEYKIGDEVTYYGDKYYVINTSDTSSNFVTLLKKESLIADEVNLYSDDYVSENGEYPFYESNLCSIKMQPWGMDYDVSTECFSDYYRSKVKKVVDNWASKYNDDLVAFEGHKARLLSMKELNDNLHFTVYNSTPSDLGYQASSDTPFWAILDNKTYWTMASTDDSDKYVYAVNNTLVNAAVPNTYHIRPVINLDKCALNDSDEKCQIKKDISNDNNDNKNPYSPYKRYVIGDEVTYNNELYHVIDNSDSNNNYITLLKDRPLTVDEINNYGRDNLGDLFINKYFKESDNKIYEFEDKIGGMAYITRTGCGNNTINNDYIMDYCTTEYDASNVSKVINKWAFNFDKDLVKVNGYKSFLIDYSYIENIKDFDWFKSNKYTYWTRMTKGSKQIYSISENGLESDSIISKNAVRPAINLNKCAVELDNPNCKSEALSKKCTTNKNNYYKEYKFGDVIYYHGDKYYVLENSGNDKNYVTLLRDSSLTLDDLPNLKDNILNNMRLSNNMGFINYSCNENEICSNKYESSNIKKIVDNWMKEVLNEDELIEVDGYKARIISKEDLLENLGYEESETGSGISVNKTDITPSIFPQVGAWTMYLYDDTSVMYTYENRIGQALELTDHYTIIPVINVKKDVLKISDYTLGQEITYNNEQYYIISNDSSDKNYITLLKVKPLTQGDITLYGHDNNIFSTPYYISDTCNSGTNISGCSSDFKNSEVKKILDTWSNSFTNDLVDVDGYKIRIPSKYDFIYNLSYDMDNMHATSYIYCKSNDTPSWVNEGYPYWSMEIYEDSNYLVHQNMPNGCLEVYVMPHGLGENSFQSSSIRPVINLNKCVIGGCDDDCSNNSGNVIDVDNTLNNITKFILVLSVVLILTGIAFITYNYFKSKQENIK